MKGVQDLKEADLLSTLEKTQVLQESRCFGASPIIAHECIPVMSKVLLLLNQGSELTDTETTDIFFRVSKLYQSEHSHIRKLLFLLLKDLNPKEGEVFMITSSLSRDVSTAENPYYKAGALRVMAKIIDPSLLLQMERYIKNCIVDKNDAVSASALLTGLKLSKSHPEVVKKWVTEVQEKLNSKNFNVHYHAMLLLYEMKKNDPLALSKFFESMIGANLKSPLARTQLIRFMRISLKNIPFDKSILQKIGNFLMSALKQSQDMVVYEAAKTICEYSDILEGYNVSAAIAVLQLFLSSNKNTTKLAGIRTINNYAVKHSNLLYSSTREYEPLISESNRTIATMAISTLLKLSTEDNVDHLLSQIEQFMSECTDDFKIELIESVKTLCARMPQKTKSLLNFVGSVLKGEGGFLLKQNIVDTLMNLMESLPSSSEVILTVLADFIEDCSFEFLQCKVLFILGELGPNTSDPSRYIRYIYNRFILEKGMVRAAAVTALAKFGRTTSLTENVQVLLKRCLEDKEDEVRERAKFYLNCLEKDHLPSSIMPVSISQLEAGVLKCQESGKPFSLEEAQTVKEKPEETKTQAKLPEKPKPTGLQSIPDLAKLGSPIVSTNSSPLTEKTAEFLVSYATHYFEDFVVLDFTVENTLETQSLENVMADMQFERTPLEQLLVEDDGIEIYPCKEVQKQASGKVYVKLKLLEGSVRGSIPTALKFDALEYEGDQVVARFEDHYPVENVTVELAAYTQG